MSPDLAQVGPGQTAVQPPVDDQALSSHVAGSVADPGQPGAVDFLQPGGRASRVHLGSPNPAAPSDGRAVLHRDARLARGSVRAQGPHAGRHGCRPRPVWPPAVALRYAALTTHGPLDIRGPSAHRPISHNDSLAKNNYVCSEKSDRPTAVRTRSALTERLVITPSPRGRKISAPDVPICVPVAGAALGLSLAHSACGPNSVPLTQGQRSDPRTVSGRLVAGWY